MCPKHNKTKGATTMDTLTQSAKELLAIQTLKELGCFDEAIRIAKNSKDTQNTEGLPFESISYLVAQMNNAIKTIEDAESKL